MPEGYTTPQISSNAIVKWMKANCVSKLIIKIVPQLTYKNILTLKII